ncbi:ribosomal protein L9, Nterminal domain containing protein [Acanthamoeba castellanii str. Neff]|uniref:50S ribosomal protein L9, chloroplastic n=1 Tax=Acanthamoeba castellanii (strain ATCC 30010 / Neff) TaxID=1257118 RepID=L8GSW4_ACACF|nr:ribosomal protein L9, Nterminal domain containing protein [Acanthamoeba castellanii str. Neff]ELR15211.1 ribosomal protein L9, Nterminal domain containing protein [Acanthamoeba castellanii str. Neff]
MRGYATKKTAAPAKAKPKSKASGPQKSNKPVKNKKIKIVLTSDVPSVGVKGEDVEVAKGFARNYLFPQKLAVYCTEENLKLYEADRANIDYEKRQKLQELAKAKKRLSKVEVLMKRQIIQVQPEQILHAPVTADNIVEKLWLQHKIQLAKDQLDLEAPISQLGTFSVPVKLEDIDVPLKVRVQAR